MSPYLSFSHFFFSLFRPWNFRDLSDFSGSRCHHRYCQSSRRSQSRRRCQCQRYYLNFSLLFSYYFVVIVILIYRIYISLSTFIFLDSSLNKPCQSCYSTLISDIVRIYISSIFNSLSPSLDIITFHPAINPIIIYNAV